MPLGGEAVAVQSPILTYAQEAGWAYLRPDEAQGLRRGEGSGLLHGVLLDQLQRLNPGVVDHARAEELIRRLEIVAPNIEGNLQAWEYLKGLRTVFVPEHRRERNVAFLDPINVEANAFHVTDEFTFDNGTHRIRADVVFLVNGVPVIVVETKAATHIEGIAEAFDQIRRYHREGPELMALMQLYALTHLVQFYYGATWSLSRKSLFNWRDEQAGDFETLVKTFVTPRRVLRILTEFILFTRKDGELSKVVLRPHQMRATERVVRRAKDRHKQRGLVWHTQGSGKTYTMITVAQRLMEDPSLNNPTVLMLVDRNELEAQLFGNLESVGLSQAVVAQSKRHLQELLRHDQRGLIVSMIHKFDDIPADINTRHNIFVLVDEAHRTTGGDLGNYLMGALPNATYIGFTGTPIDRTAHGQGTFKTFGSDDPKGYLDKYSIRESIEDGTTVPLNYALAPNDLQVDREVLNREFLDLAELEGVSEIEELNRVLDRAVTLRNLLKNHERVERVARHVAQHFRTNVEPMGYKAFLVGVDREACALLKEALDRHLPSEYSKVVISAGHNDEPLLVRHHLSDHEEREVRQAFRDPQRLPKILIVTEKLLTGYDAPILYCMYLDKPMRDHVLLQAIARVNRPYEDDQGHRKPAGFVLDYVGVFDHLEKALAFDSEDVEGVVQGLEVLKAQFQTMMELGKREYLDLGRGLRADKEAEAYLEHFRDKEERDEFYRYFRELQELYEIISPDAFLRPFVEDYDHLGRVYRLVRSAFEPHVPVDRGFMRKTAALVQQHTQTSVIMEPREVYRIGPEVLDQLAESEQSDTVRVFNLIKALHLLVEEQEKEAPHLIPIGERAAAIAQAFEQRQLTAKEALERLEDLIEEYKEAQRTRESSDLSREGFGVYWLLHEEGLEGAEEVAKQVEPCFSQYPHWQRSQAQEREVRLSLYKALAKTPLSGKLTEVVDRLLTVLKRAAP
ncbi:MAG: HsdR family type I site-specific deoxyribonuclease [Anaerolineae bacterium]|nr:HsdR family type I site-specific deoxyribonuclease [Anaerolineae bacterium]